MLSGGGKVPVAPGQSDDCEQLTPDDLLQIFAPWAGARHILVAVSGGPDSMALLHMLAHWAGSLADGPRISAATVDHGLREDAVLEAALVSRLAASLDVPCEVLKWEPPGVLTRIQEAARDARYGLLLERARETEADVLMTAHHADDQAETVLFRLVRGTGIGGLAGMRPSSDRLGLELARPLLMLHKQDLVAYCNRMGIGFAHDPSNAEERFARVRMRALLPLLEDEGMDAAAWCRLADRAARADEALAIVSARTADSLVRQAGETIEIDFERLAGEPEELVLRVVGAQIASIGGADASGLRLGKLENAVEDLLEARAGAERLVLTLAGVRLELRQDGALSVTKAPPRKVIK